MLIFITTELYNAVFQIDKDKDGFVSLDEFLRASNGDEFEKDEGWKSVEEEPPYTDEELAEFEKQLAEEEAKRKEAEKHATDTAKNLAGGVVQVGNLFPHGRFLWPIMLRKLTNLFLSVLYTLYTLQGIESNINVHGGFL